MPGILPLIIRLVPPLGSGWKARRALLGRRYAIRGHVVEGDRRGTGLGFPTANLDPENEILPISGVYAGWVRALDAGSSGKGDVAPGGAAAPAVVNIGHRPTFKSEDEVCVEAHLLDFQGDLYGQRIELAFSHRLREERRFSDVEELKARIERDVVEARGLLAGETAP